MAIQTGWWTKLLTPGLRCWITTRGAHAWKRAVRTLGNAGVQRCRYCTATRPVTLRARRQPVVL